MDRYYYALFDSTVSRYNHGYGFSNSKRAICFSTYKKMMDFVKSRYFDFSCKRISRKQAMKMLEPYYNTNSKGLLIDDIESFHMQVFRKSIFDD